MIYNIQILRAIAAYLVVFHHIQSHFVDNYSVAAISNIGIIGVDVFFVISGFIMILTASGEARSPLSFWCDRLIRIVPLYWLATFFLVGLSLIGLAPTGLHSWDLQDLLASLLFIPEVRADGAGMPILFVGWTLNYEMFFYLLFGLALLLRNQLLSVVALTGLFLGLAIAGRIFTPSSFAVTFYMNPIMLEFAAGCILGLLYVRSRSFTLQRSYGIAIPLIGLAVVSAVMGDIFYRGLILELPEARLLMVGIPAIMIVVAALVLEKSGKYFSGKFFLLQGAASYAVYLFHALVLQMVFKIASKLLDIGTASIAIAISLIALLAVCIVGTLIHLWFEKPVARLLRGRRQAHAPPKGLSRSDSEPVQDKTAEVSEAGRCCVT